MTTPYRNDIDALRQRKDALEAELARLRAETKVLENLKAQEAFIAGELSGIEARLNASSGKRALPMLDDVRIASPCSANWDEMVGDDRVRYCLSCEKNVFNLSAMTREDAEALLAARTTEMCVRLYRRADGTVLTQDCPVGVKKKQRKKHFLAVAGAGVMTAAASTMMMRETCTVMMGEPVGETNRLLQGEMVEMGDVEEPTPAPLKVVPPLEGRPTMGRPTMGAVAIPHGNARTPKATPACDPHDPLCTVIEGSPTPKK